MIAVYRATWDGGQVPLALDFGLELLSQGFCWDLQVSVLVVGVPDFVACATGVVFCYSGVQVIITPRTSQPPDHNNQ